MSSVLRTYNIQLGVPNPNRFRSFVVTRIRTIVTSGNLSQKIDAQTTALNLTV